VPFLHRIQSRHGKYGMAANHFRVGHAPVRRNRRFDPDFALKVQLSRDLRILGYHPRLHLAFQRDARGVLREDPRCHRARAAKQQDGCERPIRLPEFLLHEPILPKVEKAAHRKCNVDAKLQPLFTAWNNQAEKLATLR
jgi:hypothetical protein